MHVQEQRVGGLFDSVVRLLCLLGGVCVGFVLGLRFGWFLGRCLLLGLGWHGEISSFYLIRSHER